MRRHAAALMRALFVCGALPATGAAYAQADCSRLVEDLRGRCEAVNRMQQICAGLRGDAYRTCERQNIELPTREECSKAPRAARAMCEEHNRAVDRIERCKGKTGPDLQACARANASKPGMRQL